MVPSSWFNPPKPSLQSRALCGAVSVLPIAKGPSINVNIFTSVHKPYTFGGEGLGGL